jgi:hypothetical protein
MNESEGRKIILWNVKQDKESKAPKKKKKATVNWLSRATQ